MKTETEFLAELLLNSDMDQETTNLILERIIELQQPTISQPYILTNICEHEYPNPWFGTIPPSCKKCGQISLPYTITSI